MRIFYNKWACVQAFFTGFCLSLLVVGCIAWVPPLGASEPRFGDSTWVAPIQPGHGGPDDSTGLRVAPPDHERTWETILRAPFRLVFFPFRLLARGLEFGVSQFAGRALEAKPTPAQHGPRLSVRVDVNDVTTGFEDLGVGPAVSWRPTRDVRVRASSAFSIKNRRRARFQTLIQDARPLSFQVDGDYDFKPDRSYFGTGNDTDEDDRAFFRLENTRLDGALRIGASPIRRIRLLAGYSNMSPGVGQHRTPLLDEVFPAGTVPFGRTATRYVAAGIGGDLATLDDPISPSLGLHGRAELRRNFGLREADPDYNQWLVEGRAYLPVFAKRRVLAFRAAYAGVDPLDDNAAFPFYRLMQSGGPLRFAGYSTQRFRDRQLVLGHVEYRWNISHRISAVALYEVGAVAPERSSFRLRDMHTSWGGGLRLGRAENSAIRLDIGHSVEGLHATFRLRNEF